jgi:hypothetical protein
MVISSVSTAQAGNHSNAKMCFQSFLMLITVQPFLRLAVDHLGEDADLRAVPTPAPLACSRSASLCRLAKSRSVRWRDLAHLAAEDPVDANRVSDDDRQDHDAAVEQESQ